MQPTISSTEASMAILDRRLIPFIEMLTDLGLDWLAFELVDGIRRGLEPEETAEALIMAREQVRADEVNIVKSEPAVGIETEPLLGDAQLEWTAHYVDERLKETLAEMLDSLNNIDGIIGPPPDKVTADAHPGAAAIVLRDRDEDRKVGRAQAEEARNQLLKLREALASWLASTRTDIAQ
jgi:hypothetical protein